MKEAEADFERELQRLIRDVDVFERRAEDSRENSVPLQDVGHLLYNWTEELSGRVILGPIGAQCREADDWPQALDNFEAVYGRVVGVRRRVGRSQERIRERLRA